MSRDECVYVGGHPYDVQCAESAGMGVIWMNAERAELPDEVIYKPDIEIRNLAELMALFQ
jgi:FMN phosphatase YigB (HAD superfamily)